MAPPHPSSAASSTDPSTNSNSNSTSSALPQPKWHSDLQEVSDPTDWLQTPFSFLKDLDASLRCEICSDILRAPVSIKTCQHVFCSGCIRDYINQPSTIGNPKDRPCPNCRQPKVYDSELVPIQGLEMAAEAWRGVRPQLERVKREVESLRAQLEQRSLPLAASSASSSSLSSSTGGVKRRKVASSSSQMEESSARTTTTTERSSPRRVTRSSTTGAKAVVGRVGDGVQDAIIVDDDEVEDVQRGESDDEWTEGKEQNRATSSSGNTSPVKGNGARKNNLQDVQPSDIVVCPMCNYTFTYVALNRHLDQEDACKGPDQPPPSDRERGLAPKGSVGSGSKSSFGGFFHKPSKANLSSSSSSHGTKMGTSTSSSSSSSDSSAMKLKRPQYRLLSERDLKRQCLECGLSGAGNKSVLESRHRRWIDLYNANLDSAPRFRRSEVALRREMGQWEREREREASSLLARIARNSSFAPASASASALSSASHSNGVAGAVAGGGGGGGGGGSTTTAGGGGGMVGPSEEERRRYAALNRDQFKALAELGRRSHLSNKEKHAAAPASQERGTVVQEDTNTNGEVDAGAEVGEGEDGQAHLVSITSTHSPTKTRLSSLPTKDVNPAEREEEKPPDENGTSSEERRGEDIPVDDEFHDDFF